MERPEDRMALKVISRNQLTSDICEFTLAGEGGAALPPFTPGAHITVETPSGAMRRYSLLNEGEAPETYVIAVKREANSRGGSASMHDDVHVGTALNAEPPKNEFALVAAPKYLLIAGGIGVTPILSMARALSQEGTAFSMIYCTRSANETAYLDECRGFPGAIVHHDKGEPDNFYDFWEHFEEPGPEHVYCCGPAPLMEEIKAVSGHWPEGRIHFEDFKAAEVVRENDVPFKVTVASTGRTIEIPADRSILEALRDAGEATVSSCESGTCGTCKCKLVDGDVDHRDLVLMEEEKSDHIMICVSRARSGGLVIDL
ncbi:PDR/VanB family oxidoreductase [Microbaculum marinisediminis]|uniref:PDR/VanB family oxidoreductase n=1 Tax=Microbaculum marinisediminis TaxID=2931392 RepID=A0AAW5R1A3_9HYPH|nr:PDR/VanB family oxidoreductase [Microbaculum sp. A6E488]MCT8973982.1 PDR/VanB family oxidoreductase [Microbaculum sp. A6E488]